ncbi:hypothetical protein FB451DRAFT_1165868 [Mycena latifolia]|nr:hypothetical protein FB451DRAFT_1165868 [Mycena latifolia]
MLRYVSLGIAFSLPLLYAIHLKRPSTQLSQLEDVFQTTEAIICDAKLHCPQRDLVILLKVEKIQNDIQLIVEAEHQRKYIDDINETEIILTSLRSPHFGCYLPVILHFWWFVVFFREWMEG